MSSAYSLSKRWQQTALLYSFLSSEPISCSTQGSNCCFLTLIQVSQEIGKMVWYPHLFKSFPQIVMIHTVNLLGIIVLQFVGHLPGDCGEVNGDLLQEGLCHALCDPGLLYPEPLSPRQATADPYLHRRHSDTQRQVWLSLCGASGSWYAQILLEPPENLWQVWGLILKAILPLLPSWWGFLFSLEHGVSFLGGIPHSPVDGCSAVSCNFEVLIGEDEYTSFYSSNLGLIVWVITNSGKFLKIWQYQPTLPASWKTCMWAKKQQFRTRHRIVYWFQIRKGVHQGCILTPCLFNFYAEYII